VKVWLALTMQSALLGAENDNHFERLLGGLKRHPR
jgi:hypothetical protein